MALTITTALKNTRLDAIDDAINAGSAAGYMRLYTATRPAGPGTAISSQTLLGTLTFSDPAFAAASGGTMTANAITNDSSADNNGTAAWGRAFDSDGNAVFDFSVGTSGADLNLLSTTITAGQPISVSSMVLTEGN